MYDRLTAPSPCRLLAGRTCTDAERVGGGLLWPAARRPAAQAELAERVFCRRLLRGQPELGLAVVQLLQVLGIISLGYHLKDD